MTEKSIRYLKVLEKVKEEEISREQAAEELNISVRQVYRLYERLLKDGPGGFPIQEARQAKQSSAT